MRGISSLRQSADADGATPQVAVRHFRIVRHGGTRRRMRYSRRTRHGAGFWATGTEETEMKTMSRGREGALWVGSALGAGAGEGDETGEKISAWGS